MANTACNNMLTVLEHCRISPPFDPSVTTKILPLTFSDMVWLYSHSFSRVYFYDFPCSTTEFIQTLVPHLRKSLALSLKYYFPLCGNLIAPITLTNDTTPAIRYSINDSVSLTIAEFSGPTSKGYQHLSGNHARDVEDLFALVPQLPQGDAVMVEDDSIMVSPVLSIQVTLFPDQGFSIGFTNSHAVADGKALSNFIRTWASINSKQLKGEHDCDNLDTLPFYDRSVIKDPKGIAKNFLRARYENSKALVCAAPKKDMVRATLVMKLAQIRGLKNLVLAQIPHVSTFTVTCAYVWACMAKARAILQQDRHDANEVEEHFGFTIDIRARLDPPISSSYFGNAITFREATLRTCKLVGGDGFINAVEEIRKVLHEQINHKDGVLEGLETLFDRIEAMNIKGQRLFTVSGSPKFDYYSTDFGWGRPKKYELLTGEFALNGFRDSKEDFEIGICLPKNEMDAFTTIFYQGLIN